MHHRAHVWLVHPHAECDGGHDDIDLTREKFALHPFAHTGFEPGVIGLGGEVGLEPVGQFLRGLA